MSGECDLCGSYDHVETSCPSGSSVCSNVPSIECSEARFAIPLVDRLLASVDKIRANAKAMVDSFMAVDLIENDITRNSERICKLGKILKDGEAEVIQEMAPAEIDWEHAPAINMTDGVESSEYVRRLYEG